MYGCCILCAINSIHWKYCILFRNKLSEVLDLKACKHFLNIPHTAYGVICDPGGKFVRIAASIYLGTTFLKINFHPQQKAHFMFLSCFQWGAKALRNMLIVPPGSGIVHQVNLEYLARVVFDVDNLLYPDSLVGTDSHTTMINGLGIAGWGRWGYQGRTGWWRVWLDYNHHQKD